MVFSEEGVECLFEPVEDQIEGGLSRGQENSFFSRANPPPWPATRPRTHTHTPAAPSRPPEIRAQNRPARLGPLAPARSPRPARNPRKAPPTSPDASQSPAHQPQRFTKPRPQSPTIYKAIPHLCRRYHQGPETAQCTENKSKEITPI